MKSDKFKVGRRYKYQKIIMKVLMFGWEFPPLNSGGLGTACYGLTKGLAQNGVKVVMVLPRPLPVNVDFLEIENLDFPDVDLIACNSLLQGYCTSHAYQNLLASGSKQQFYGGSLFEEVVRYAELAPLAVYKHDFDIIHAHDWLTWQAGLRAGELSGKPVVLHVHATEFDRCGGDNVHPHVHRIEQESLRKADKIIAVSEATKRKIIKKYGVKPEKVAVLHNGIDVKKLAPQTLKAFKGKKLVIFIGRLTLQKGPDYFLQVAKRVLDMDPDVRFVVGGSGDMLHRLIQDAARLGIADKLLFAGFLRNRALEKVYQSADVYVMPSVSEPFGIGALEAINHGTPVIVSKNAGVCEAFPHCLKVDFWDIEKMANKILSVLRYSPLGKTMVEEGKRFLPSLSWEKIAKKCANIYQQLLGSLRTNK